MQTRLTAAGACSMVSRQSVSMPSVSSDSRSWLTSFAHLLRRRDNEEPPPGRPTERDGLRCRSDAAVRQLSRCSMSRRTRDGCKCQRTRSSRLVNIVARCDISGAPQTATSRWQVNINIKSWHPCIECVAKRKSNPVKLYCYFITNRLKFWHSDTFFRSSAKSQVCDNHFYQLLLSLAAICFRNRCSWCRLANMFIIYSYTHKMPGADCL